MVYGTDEEIERLYPFLADPTSEQVRERYIAWLDANAPLRAQVLRQLVSLDTAEGAGVARAQEQLRGLVPQIDPVWWKLIRGRVIRHCGAAQFQQPKLRFQFECEQSWLLLQATDDPQVRYCDTCEHRVYRCDSVEEAAEHARRGHCIAVARNMAYTATRKRSSMIMGRPNYERLWAEQVFGESE